jgi:hypothetical protein
MSNINRLGWWFMLSNVGGIGFSASGQGMTWWPAGGRLDA